MLSLGKSVFCLRFSVPLGSPSNEVDGEKTAVEVGRFTTAIAGGSRSGPENFYFFINSLTSSEVPLAKRL